MNAFLTSMIEIVSNASDIGNVALVFISHFTIVIIWGGKFSYIFESRSKNDVGETSANFINFQVFFTW